MTRVRVGVVRLSWLPLNFVHTESRIPTGLGIFKLETYSQQRASNDFMSGFHLEFLTEWRPIKDCSLMLPFLRRL